MTSLSRRTAIRQLGLLTASSLAGRSTIAAVPSVVQTPFVSYVARDSICVFLDGAWLLRALEGKLIALTTPDNDHSYTQGKWDFQNKQLQSTSLDPGMYEVTVFGSRNSCGCSKNLLAAQRSHLPYLNGVQCEFEPTPSGPGLPIDKMLRIISLPTPDKIHTAARITIGKGDYLGQDCHAHSTNFKFPSDSSTVVILEYKHADSLVLTNTSSGSVLSKAAQQDHYHFRVGLNDMAMTGKDQEKHIIDFTKALTGKLRHQGDNTSVDFFIDPVELGDPQSCNKLHLRIGVGGVTKEELGISDLHKKPKGCSETGPVYILNEVAPQKETLFYARLANCAAGVIAG